MIDIFQIYAIKMTDTKQSTTPVDTPTQPVVEPKTSTTSVQVETQPVVTPRSSGILVQANAAPEQTTVTNGSIAQVRATLIDIQNRIYNVQTSLLELKHAIQTNTINKGTVTKHLMTISTTLDNLNSALNTTNAQINELLY